MNRVNFPARDQTRAAISVSRVHKVVVNVIRLNKVLLPSLTMFKSALNCQRRLPVRWASDVCRLPEGSSGHRRAPISAILPHGTITASTVSDGAPAKVAAIVNAGTVTPLLHHP